MERSSKISCEDVAEFKRELVNLIDGRKYCKSTVAALFGTYKFLTELEDVSFKNMCAYCKVPCIAPGKNI